MSNSTINQEIAIFQADQIYRALKSSGYKSTAHALAELMDNSIQAGGTEVHVYMFSDDVKLAHGYSERVVKIAVLDNGDGMDAAVLKKSIGFGNGTRLGAKSGLGKFGMGLSAASIAFNDETAVYSWQNGVESALATYLSAERIKRGEFYLPEPLPVEIDSDVLKWADSNIYSHGSLVVWSKLDINPKRFSALSRDLEALIGRIYRKFLYEGSVGIYIHDVCRGDERNVINVLPNDPLYLMAPSCTPPPYENESMFVLLKDNGEWVDRIETVNSNGEVITGDVRVKISHVRPGLRTAYKRASNVDAGNAPFGKHAKSNVGYSICREGRELNLDPAFAKPFEVTERWWGVEVDFDASLDEIFEVTSNKQEALATKKFHHWSWDAERIGNESEAQFLQRLEVEEDPRLPLIKLFNTISKHVAVIRTILKGDVEGDRSRTIGDATRPEAVATAQAKKREEEGHRGEADDLKAPSADEVIEIAEEEGVQPDGQEHLKEVLKAGDRFGFEIGRNEESESFFIVKRKGNFLAVIINSAHPFYEQVYEKLFGEGNAVSLEEQLSLAQDGFKLTLLAWARLEDEAMAAAPGLRQNRGDWGRLLKDFLREPEAGS